jgi:nucleotide-binding universal stress UspA family protein
MTQKIFVPLDGSSCALRALQHAVTLATRMGDFSLHVAHAHEEPLIYGEIAVYVPRDKMDRLQREQSERILAAADPILTAAGVPYEKEILVGPVAQVLAERAGTLGCDAIVMDTHGLSAVGQLLMGSVAAKVVHFSNIPITLVK